MIDVIYFENGEQTTKELDLNQSYDLSKSDDVKRGQCYRNSFLAMPQLHNAEYVEGYAIFYSERVFNLWRHGWLEKDGVIVDNYPGTGTLFGTIYFPIKKYSYDEAIEVWSQQGQPPFSFSLRRLVHAINVYHNAIRPEGYSEKLWNVWWLSTATKLLLAWYS